VKLFKGAHTKYSLFYHFVFCIKYRRKVLTNQVEERLKEMIKDMATFYRWQIEELEGYKDHIHLFLSAPPKYSPAKIVNLIKSWTRNQIFKEYPKLKQYLWGSSFWSDSYFVSTVNDNTTRDQIKRYIQQQKDYQKQLSLWNKKRWEDREILRPSTGGEV